MKASDRLERLIDLAQRGEYLQVSPPMRIRCWERVAEQAATENYEYWWEYAENRIITLTTFRM